MATAIARRFPNWSDIAREAIRAKQEQINNIERGRSLYEAAAEAIDAALPNHDAKLKIDGGNVSAHVSLLSGDAPLEIIEDIVRTFRRGRGFEMASWSVTTSSIYWPTLALWLSHDLQKFAVHFELPSQWRNDLELRGVRMDAREIVTTTEDYRLLADLPTETETDITAVLIGRLGARTPPTTEVQF